MLVAKGVGKTHPGRPVLRSLGSGVCAHDHVALRGINLLVGSGEMVGVVGPAGAGKSTLLRVIAGALERTAGEVRCAGRIVAAFGDDTGHDPRLSGNANIANLCRRLDLPPRLATALTLQVSEHTGLRERLEDPLATYSTLTAARFRLCLAVNAPAELIVIDEALDLVDARERYAYFEQLRRRQAGGAAVLVAGRAIDELAHRCDRIVVLGGGRKAYDGVPAAGLELANRLCGRVAAPVRPQAAAPIDSRDEFDWDLPYADASKERGPALQLLRFVMQSLPAGDGPQLMAECGVFKGHLLVAAARMARALGSDMRFIGLDSFVGFPPPSPTDQRLIAPQLLERAIDTFADTSLTAVQARVDAAGVADRVTLVPGFFEHSLPTLEEQRYAFVNIDCDLFEPHLQCLDYFYPRTVRGGIIFFDDYHSSEFPSARAAIDAFLAGRPERLFHLRLGDDTPNHTKSFVVKV